MQRPAAHALSSAALPIDAEILRESHEMAEVANVFGRRAGCLPTLWSERHRKLHLYYLRFYGYISLIQAYQRVTARLADCYQSDDRECRMTAPKASAIDFTRPAESAVDVNASHLSPPKFSLVALHSICLLPMKI